jgi:hypothetical protein
MKRKTSFFFENFEKKHRKERSGISAELAKNSQRAFGEIMKYIETRYLDVNQRSNNRSEI